VEQACDSEIRHFYRPCLRDDHVVRLHIAMKHASSMCKGNCASRLIEQHQPLPQAALLSLSGQMLFQIAPFNELHGDVGSAAA
jgi:hypothetical protein